MDLLIFFAALSLGSIAAIFAYKIGGRSWTVKFAIRGPLLENGKRNRAADFKPRSGIYAELSVQTIILTVMLFVSFLTPDTSIHGIIQKYPLLFLGLLATITTIVVIYEIYISNKAAKAGKKTTPQLGRGRLFAKRLARGYIPYTLYSVISFFAIIMIVAMISDQTYAHYNQYLQANIELDTLLLRLSSESLVPADKMVLVEQIYFKVLEGAAFMVDQINTLVLLVFASFALQYTIKHTPIGQIFEPDAMVQFDVLLWLSIALIAILAWSVHFFVYKDFFDGALLVMDQNRTSIAEGGWEMLERFHSHYLDLLQRQGLTGFVLSLTNDRGGLLLALGAVGWVVKNRHAKNHALVAQAASAAK